jgi:hypothetical protein
MMEAARTSETSVDNHFTRQYNPEDSSEQQLFTQRIIWNLQIQNAELLVVKAAGTYSHRPAIGVNGHQTVGPKDTVGVEVHRRTDMMVTRGCLSTYNCAKRSLK